MRPTAQFKGGFKNLISLNEEIIYSPDGRVHCLHLQNISFVSIFKAVDGCYFIRCFVSRVIHNFCTCNARINVFRNVSIIWESTVPLFSFRQLTFNNSVSFSPLFLIILDGKEIFTLFFTKKLFIVTCTYCVCSTRIHSIIYAFLFLDTHQNYYLASVWNVFFSNVLTLQLVLVIAGLGHY